LAGPRLPDSVYSPEQLRACAMEMEIVAGWRRHQDIKRRTGQPSQAVPDFGISADLTELVGSEEEISKLSGEEISAWREQLALWLKQPVVHLTFAVAPHAATKLAMVRWFRNEISPAALLKFEVNRNIVGGMVVRTPSRIIDLSFRRRLQGGRDLLPQLLRRLDGTERARA
jgi:hypothetical protein